MNMLNYYRIKIRETLQNDFLDNCRKHKRNVAFINNWLEENGICYQYRYDDYCLGVLNQADSFITNVDAESLLDFDDIDVSDELEKFLELFLSLKEVREILIKPMIQQKILSLGYNLSNIMFDFNKTAEQKIIKIGKVQGVAKIHYVLHTCTFLRDLTSGDTRTISDRQELFEDAEPLVARKKVFDKLINLWENTFDSLDLFQLNDKQLKKRGHKEKIQYFNSIHIIVDDPE